MKDSAFDFDLSTLFFLSPALVFAALYMTSSGPFRGTDFVGLALLEAELENVKKGSICAADLDQAFLKAVTQYKKKGTGDTIIREEIPLRSTEECAPLDETMQSSFNGLFGGKIIRTGTSAPPPPPPARAPVFQSSMPIVSPSIYAHPHRQNGNFVPPPVLL